MYDNNQKEYIAMSITMASDHFKEAVIQPLLKNLISKLPFFSKGLGNSGC